MTFRGDRRHSSTARGLHERLKELESVLDKSWEEHQAWVERHAKAASDYKREHAKAKLTSESSTVSDRESTADMDTSELLYKKILAEGMEKNALEAIRNNRQKVSALQSLSGAYKEEGAFERTKPGG